MPSVLVTGAAGYIGSHAVQRLLRDGHNVVALDNLDRGHAEAIAAIASSPAASAARFTFIHGDIADRPLLEAALREHRVHTVMHFAALAYVGESVTEPLRYYRNNSASALALLEAVDASHSDDAAGYPGVQKFVFSSTCATYGEPGEGFIPIPETCPQSPINPYGWSKLHTERMLFDFAAARRAQGRPIAVAALRYFNVAGSDRSGLLGEHHEPETHLIPVVLDAILGKRDSVTVFGTDYPTPDGTCIRDYVHVEDLVDAHLAVMAAMDPKTDTAPRIYNLGIGKGYSVREVLDACRRVTGREFVVKEGARRPGDPPRLFANPAKIREELGWRASITSLDEIVASAWAWFQRNPRGYRTQRPG